jgi:hypothetical protein
MRFLQRSIAVPAVHADPDANTVYPGERRAQHADSGTNAVYSGERRAQHADSGTSAIDRRRIGGRSTG